MNGVQANEDWHTRAQLTKYRSKIRAAYTEGTLSSDQIERLRSAGFCFDADCNSKPVVDLSTGETYETQNEATIAIGAARGELRLAIQNKRLCKGHAFWYADDPNPPALSEYRSPRTSSKPVVDLTTGKCYDSLNAAVKAAGVAHGKAIRSAIEHKRLLNGHAFWWADDPTPPSIKTFRESAGQTRPIVDLNSGVVFETQRTAASSVQGSKTQLRAAIEDKRLFKGHAFWWADDPNPPAIGEFRKPSCKSGNIKPIIDLTTGEQFKSLSAVANAITVANGTTVRGAIEHKRLLNGHAFWWADDPNPPDVSEFRIPASQTKPVVDLTTGEVFETIVFASKAIGAGYAGIVRKAIEHKHLLKGHALWWAADPEPPAVGEFREPAHDNSKR